MGVTNDQHDQRMSSYDEGPWWPGDESGYEHYQAKLAAAVGIDGFARWKIATNSRNVAHQLAGARNRARAAWVALYGAEEELWPLAHPPGVVWIPASARAVCLRCSWFDFSATDLGAAAGAARRHAGDHLDVADRQAVDLLLAPIQVYSHPDSAEPGQPVTTG